MTAATEPSLPYSPSSRPRRRARRTAPAAGPPDWLRLLPEETTVGVGHVVGVEDDGRPRLRVARAAEPVVGTWAIPYRYVPREGDLLWVIGRRERHYVLGVLRGRGRSELGFPADAVVSAEGTLGLVADRAVRLGGVRVDLRVGALEVVAGAVRTKAERAAHRVRGLLRVVAGRSQRVTAGQERVRARRVDVLAEESVRYDAADAVKIG